MTKIADKHKGLRGALFGVTFNLHWRNWYYDLSLSVRRYRLREYKWYPPDSGAPFGDWQLLVRFLWFGLGAAGIHLREDRYISGESEAIGNVV